LFLLDGIHILFLRPKHRLNMELQSLFGLNVSERALIAKRDSYVWYFFYNFSVTRMSSEFRILRFWKLSLTKIQRICEERTSL
jgi:hypothetical protein